MLKFLKLVGEAAQEISNHLPAFITAGYGASPGRLRYEAAKKRRHRERARAMLAEDEKLRQRYYLMLHRLKAQGLIKVSGRGNEKKISRTLRGDLKLKQLRYDMENRLQIPTYHLEPDNHVLIIAFDVPEEDRRKRAWLRSVLKNMGLKMIQQSFWVGKGALPRSFLDDLDRMGLTDFVEICEVTKSGTLRAIG